MATVTFPTIANNAKTTLASDITSGATSLTLASGGAAALGLTGSTNFIITIITAGSYQTASETLEIIHGTGVSTDTLTGLTRAYDGTSASAFTAGDIVEIRVTKAHFEEAWNVLSGVGTISGNDDILSAGRVTATLGIYGAKFYSTNSGSATSPSHSWSSDGDTGMYLAGTNSIGISVGTATAMTISSATDIDIEGALTLSTDEEKINIVSNGGVYTGNIYLTSTGFFSIDASSGVQFRYSTASKMIMSSTVLRPHSASLLSLGSSVYPWADAYCDDNFVTNDIEVGSGSILSSNFEGTNNIEVLSTAEARIIIQGTGAGVGRGGASLALIDEGWTAGQKAFTIWNEDGYVTLTKRGDTASPSANYFRFDMINNRTDVTTVMNYTFTMGTGALDPTTDAPVDWIEVRIAGTTRYIPVYS